MEVKWENYGMPVAPTNTCLRLAGMSYKKLVLHTNKSEMDQKDKAKEKQE